MRRTALILLALLTACSDSSPAATDALTSLPPVSVTTTPAPTTSSTTTTTTSTTTTSTTTTTIAPAVQVSSPGTYEGDLLNIRIRFESRIEGVTSDQLAEQAIAILNDETGWVQSGFTFEHDPESELAVVLAEGAVVDELCLPLETYGKVSCQNGPVVALNADRWRLAGDDWDSTVEAYRIYLINHEVGHLIGLRHPLERCPTDSKISALMEPQTNNLDGCIGNGTPLQWEIEWALNRPVVVGPNPDWDGPFPSWPTDA